MRRRERRYLSIAALGVCGLAGVGVAELGRVIDGPREVHVRYVRANFSPIGSRFPVYPYSIVPGGVHSTEQMDSARRDKLVDQHYGGMVPTIAYELRANHLVYVSYRKDNRIYWTTKKLLVKAGEPVIITNSDRLLVRQRCGNLLSDLPMQPTLPEAQEKPVLEAMEAADAPQSTPEGEKLDLGVPYVETVSAPVEGEPVAGASGSPIVVGGVPAGVPGGYARGFAAFPGFVGAIPLLAAVSGGCCCPSGSTGASGARAAEEAGLVPTPEPASWGYIILATAACVTWKAMRRMRRDR